MVKSHGAAFEIIGLWGLVETYVARAAVPAAPQAEVLKLHGGVWGAELHSTLRCEDILKTDLPVPLHGTHRWCEQ